MGIDPIRLQSQEDSLTVIRGSVAVVMRYWDRLEEKDRQELLSAALKKVEHLVSLYEDDVAPLRA